MKKATISLLLLLSISFILKAQVPTNDNPANATPLTIVHLSDPLVYSNGSNQNATNTYLVDPSYGYTQVPSCVPSASQQKDIWFSFNSANYGTSITFTVNEISGSPTFGHANLFRLFSTTNCTGASGLGTFNQVGCASNGAPSSAFPTFTISGLTPYTCYFLQMSCILSTGTIWSSFEIAAEGNNTTPLPLSSITLESSRRSNCNVLNWKTFNESNIEKYQLEKMNLKSNLFEPIGAKIAPLNEMNSAYSVQDCQYELQKNAYRIKVTDIDQQSYYSKTILVDNLSSVEIGFYPNPAHDIVVTNIAVEENNYTVYAFDILGKKINLPTTIKDNKLSFDTSLLLKGMYTIKIESNEIFLVSKLIKE